MATDQDIYNGLYHVKQGLGLLIGPYKNENAHTSRAAMRAFIQVFSGGGPAQDSLRDPTYNALVRSCETLHRLLRTHPQFNEGKWQKFLGAFGEDNAFTTFLSALNDFCKSLVKPGMKNSFDDALKRTITGWSVKPMKPTAPPLTVKPSSVSRSVYESGGSSPRAPSVSKARVSPNSSRSTSAVKSRPKIVAPDHAYLSNPYALQTIPESALASPIKHQPSPPPVSTATGSGFKRPNLKPLSTLEKTIRNHNDASSPSTFSDLTESTELDQDSHGSHTTMLYYQRLNQAVLDRAKQQQYECLYGLSGFMAQLFAYRKETLSVDRRIVLQDMNLLSHLFSAAIQGKSIELMKNDIARKPHFSALYHSATQVCAMIAACYTHLQTQWPERVAKDDRESLHEATKQLQESHDFVYLGAALNKFLVMVAEGQSFDDFSNQLDRGLNEWRIALGGVRRPTAIKNSQEKSPAGRNRLLTAVQDITMSELDHDYELNKKVTDLEERLAKAEQEKMMLQAQIQQAAKPPVLEVPTEVKKPAFNPFKDGGILAQLGNRTKKETEIPFDPSAYARDSVYQFLQLYKDSVSDEKSLVSFTASGDFHVDNKRLATLLANIYGKDSASYMTLLNYDQTMNNECDVVAYLEKFHAPFIAHLESASDRMIAAQFKKAFKQWQKVYEKQIEAYLLNAAGDDTEKQRKVWAKIGIPGPVLKFIDLCQDYVEDGIAQKSILGFDEHQQFSLDSVRLRKLLEGVLSQEKTDEFFKKDGAFEKLNLKFAADQHLNAYIQDFHRLIKKVLDGIITDHDKQLKFYTFFQKNKSTWNAHHLTQLTQYADRLRTDKPQGGLGARSKSLSTLSTSVGRSASMFEPSGDHTPSPQEIRRRLSTTINVSPALIADELYVDRKNRAGIAMPHALQFLSGYRCVIACPGTDLLPICDRKEDTLYIQKILSGALVAYTHEKENGEVLPTTAMLSAIFEKVQSISDARKIAEISVILPPFVTMPKTEYSSVMLLPGVEKWAPTKMEKNVLYIQKTVGGDTVAYSSDKPNGKIVSTDKAKEFSVYFDQPQAIDKPRIIEDRSVMEAVLAMCSDSIQSHLVVIVRTAQLETFFANLSLSREKIVAFQHQLVAFKEDLSLHHDAATFIDKLNMAVCQLLDFKEGSPEQVKLLGASAKWQISHARYIDAYKAKAPPPTEHSEHPVGSVENKDNPPHASMMAKLFVTVDDQDVTSDTHNR